MVVAPEKYGIPPDVPELIPVPPRATPMIPVTLADDKSSEAVADVILPFISTTTGPA